MEVDLNRIAQIHADLKFAITHASKLYSEIAVNVVAPPDNEYEQLDVSVIKSSAEELVKNIRNLHDKISAVKEDIENAEKENSGIVEELGDTLDVKEGLKYFETGLGEGNSGTISIDGIRPEDADYVVDRIAIYANGKLIDNIGDTGTDIQKCIMDYEEEYGEIEISYHISMVGEDGSHNATGWLDRNQVAEGSLIGNDTINLEDAFKEIEEKYENYTEPVLESVKKDEINAEDAGVIAGVVSDLKSTRETTKVTNPENTTGTTTAVAGTTTAVAGTTTAVTGTTTTGATTSGTTTTTATGTTTAVTGTTTTTGTGMTGYTKATETTTTTVRSSPDKHGISLEAYGKVTDSIYFYGDISDLKKGSKFFLSNYKEKEIESIEDIGNEYKITYRGSFGGWESIYIKKDQ